MHKVIKLQSLALTNKKVSELNLARIEAKRVIQEFILPNIDSCENNSELQKLIYYNIRKTSFLPSQVLLNLIRSSFHLKEKPTDKRDINRITLDYNLPRASKMFIENGRLFFAITIRPRHRIVIPIKSNNSIQRFNTHLKDGWEPKQISLTYNNEILANIEKRKEPKPYTNHLGVDINANNVSLTVLTPQGKILKQLYLGKNLWKRKNKILLRKSKLQSYADKGNSKARYKLRKLKRKVRNITKNAIGEITKEMHNIAEKYQAKIVFERLHKFKANKGRRANKVISLIPFKLLQMQNAVRSVDSGIPLGYISGYHTSKWCPRCGSVNPSHNGSNYAIYRCSNCGLIVNSDRKASLAVAVKKFAERMCITNNTNAFFQISANRVPVNALFWTNENVVSNDAVHLDTSLEPKVSLSN